MKAAPRTVVVVLAGLVQFLLFQSPTSAEPLQTNLPHVLLMDAGTHTVLFEKGADDRVTPASTTKLMTAEIVFSLLESGKLTLDQSFAVSENAWREGGAMSRGSTMFAKLNSQISVDDLIHGLIIDSGNDAAIVLAEGIAGSQGAFATLMTRRARDLGLNDLTFTNAWGNTNPDHKVTAREMALLADHIIRTYPDFYKIFSQKEFTWNKIKQPNRNPLLFMDIGADGLKTGNIDESGYAIIGSAVQNGERLIAAIYGAKSSSERAEEARRILQWGFRTFEARKIFSAGDIVGYAKVYGGEKGDVPLVTRQDVTVLVPRDGSEKLNAKITYTGPLAAPVEPGKALATLKLFLGDKDARDAPLFTKDGVAVGSLPRRAFDAGVEYVGGLFRKYVLRS